LVDFVSYFVVLIVHWRSVMGREVRFGMLELDAWPLSFDVFFHSFTGLLLLLVVRHDARQNDG
jgi:hypothetical protein